MDIQKKRHSDLFGRQKQKGHLRDATFQTKKIEINASTLLFQGATREVKERTLCRLEDDFRFAKKCEKYKQVTRMNLQLLVFALFVIQAIDPIYLKQDLESSSASNIDYTHPLYLSRSLVRVCLQLPVLLLWLVFLSRVQLERVKMKIFNADKQQGWLTIFEKRPRDLFVWKWQLADGNWANGKKKATCSGWLLSVLCPSKFKIKTEMAVDFSRQSLSPGMVMSTKMIEAGHALVSPSKSRQMKQKKKVPLPGIDERRAEPSVSSIYGNPSLNAESSQTHTQTARSMFSPGHMSAAAQSANYKGRQKLCEEVYWFNRIGFDVVATACAFLFGLGILAQTLLSSSPDFEIYMLYFIMVYLFCGITFLQAATVSWILVLLFCICLEFRLTREQKSTYAFDLSTAYLVLSNLLLTVAAYNIELGERIDHLASLELTQQQSILEQLLENLLPAHAMQRLDHNKKHPELCRSIADTFEVCTILFSDLVSFTSWASTLRADVLILRLHELYVRFDALCDSHQVYKVETIGDAYFVSSGCPTPCPDHADRLILLGKAMMNEIESLDWDGYTPRMRIGIHSGPVVAGVVGTWMPRYHLFGQTVLAAEHLESTGKPGFLHVSQTAKDAMANSIFFNFQEREEPIVFMGERMQTYLVGIINTYDRVAGVKSLRLLMGGAKAKPKPSIQKSLSTISNSEENETDEDYYSDGVGITPKKQRVQFEVDIDIKKPVATDLNNASAVLLSDSDFVTSEQKLEIDVMGETYDADSDNVSDAEYSDISDKVSTPMPSSIVPVSEMGTMSISKAVTHSPDEERVMHVLQVNTPPPLACPSLQPTRPKPMAPLRASPPPPSRMPMPPRMPLPLQIDDTKKTAETVATAEVIDVQSTLAKIAISERSLGIDASPVATERWEPKVWSTRHTRAHSTPDRKCRRPVARRTAAGKMQSVAEGRISDPRSPPQKALPPLGVRRRAHTVSHFGTKKS